MLFRAGQFMVTKLVDLSPLVVTTPFLVVMMLLVLVLTLLRTTTPVLTTLNLLLVSIYTLSTLGIAKSSPSTSMTNSFTASNLNSTIPLPSPLTVVVDPGVIDYNLSVSSSLTTDRTSKLS